MHQGVVMLRQQAESWTKHGAAVRHARAVGKPMLVVGGPYGSGVSGRLLGMKAHGCGDLCADIDPDSCRGCPFVLADVRDLPWPDGYFGACLCPHVLEHLETLEDIDRAWGELHRVADGVYTCFPGKDSFAGWMAPGHHLWVKELGSGILDVQERGGLRRRDLIVAPARVAAT